MVMLVRASWGNHEALWQYGGHQGARAPVPALRVPRCNHLSHECTSIPPGHLGHEVREMGLLLNGGLGKPPFRLTTGTLLTINKTPEAGVDPANDKQPGLIWGRQLGTGMRYVAPCLTEH